MTSGRRAVMASGRPRRAAMTRWAGPMPTQVPASSSVNAHAPALLAVDLYDSWAVRTARTLGMAGTVGTAYSTVLHWERLARGSSAALGTEGPLGVQCSFVAAPLGLAPGHFCRLFMAWLFQAHPRCPPILFHSWALDDPLLSPTSVTGVQRTLANLPGPSSLPKGLPGSASTFLAPFQFPTHSPFRK